MTKTRLEDYKPPFADVMHVMYGPHLLVSMSFEGSFVDYLDGGELDQGSNLGDSGFDGNLDGGEL